MGASELHEHDIVQRVRPWSVKSVVAQAITPAMAAARCFIAESSIEHSTGSLDTTPNAEG